MITPAPPGSRYGNRRSALRWVKLLEGLGHRVVLSERYGGQPCDLLVALHATRSHAAALAYRERFPAAPLVVVLTGTDLYRDLPDDPQAQASLGLATRLVALHDLAGEALPAAARERLRVIVQSALPLPSGLRPLRRVVQVCVIGHLRPEKDPFRAAEAVRLLPPASRVRIVHAGGAMSPEMARRAEAEAAANPRYRWLGDLPPWRVRRLLGRSAAMVISSRMEGGANVVSEAGAGEVPVLASRIPGNLGLLGADHPALFGVADTAGLAALLERIEREPPFLEALRARMAELAPRFSPERERAGWAALLAELFPG